MTLKHNKSCKKCSFWKNGKLFRGFTIKDIDWKVSSVKKYHNLSKHIQFLLLLHFMNIHDLIKPFHWSILPIGTFVPMRSRNVYYPYDLIPCHGSVIKHILLLPGNEGTLLPLIMRLLLSVPWMKVASYCHISPLTK